MTKLTRLNAASTKSTSTGGADGSITSRLNSRGVSDTPSAA